MTTDPRCGGPAGAIVLAAAMAATASALVLPGAPPVMRGLGLSMVAVGAAVAAVAVRAGARWLLVSPAFLVGSVALAFFGLLPQFIPAQWTVPSEQIRLAMASRGDLALRIILAFVGGCFALTALHGLRGRPGTAPAAAPELDFRGAMALGAATTALCGVHGFFFLSPGLLEAAIGAEVSRQVLASLPAVASAGVMILAAAAARRPSTAVPLTLALVAVIADQTAQATIRLGITTVAIAGLTFLASGGRIRWGFAVAGTVAAVAVVAGFTWTAKHRYPDTIYAKAPAAMVSETIERKVGKRFTTTTLCFSRVLERHWPVAEGSPLYFTAALVPRALWPDKPSLSNGNDIAWAYCTGAGYQGDRQSSMSVSLLGEPVMMAGAAGLAAALAVLAVLLWAVPVVALRHGGLGIPFMAAIGPWLADFDQQFAMYLALVVKTAVVAGITVWGVSRLSRRRSAPPAPTP